MQGSWCSNPCPLFLFYFLSRLVPFLILGVLRQNLVFLSSYFDYKALDFFVMRIFSFINPLICSHVSKHPYLHFIWLKILPIFNLATYIHFLEDTSFLLSLCVSITFLFYHLSPFLSNFVFLCIQNLAHIDTLYFSTTFLRSL